MYASACASDFKQETEQVGFDPRSSVCFAPYFHQIQSPAFIEIFQGTLHLIQGLFALLLGLGVDQVDQTFRFRQVQTTVEIRSKLIFNSLMDFATISSKYWLPSAKLAWLGQTIIRERCQCGKHSASHGFGSVDVTT